MLSMVGAKVDKLRVLIIEDSAPFAEFVRRVLSSDPGLEVVGTAADGETAVRLARDTKPDVLIVDIELEGDLDGVDVAHRIRQHLPNVAVVILTAHADRRYVTSLPFYDRSGWAYLLKQSTLDFEEFLHAVKRSALGHVVLDPAVAGLLPTRE